MNLDDWIRWTVVTLCLFSIGAMVALTSRIGRYFTPRIWVLSLMIGNILCLATVAIGVHSRIGYPITWRTPLFALAAGFELAGLIGLFRWYGTDHGAANARAMRVGVDRARGRNGY